MAENALDRLFKDTQALSGKIDYSLDDQLDMVENDQSDEEFISIMSPESMNALNERLYPEKEELKVEEPEIQSEKPQEPIKEKIQKVEKVELEKEATPKQRGPKKGQNKNKNNKNSADAFLESLANECIDIMIQQGVTVHGFNETQMNIIWDFIKEKLKN